ncbi:ornithine cyclodeaminase family protein [Helicobacter pylori]
MRFISEQQQTDLLDMAEVVEAVEEALQAYSEGQTENPLRHVLPFNEDNKYLVMPALSDKLGIVGLKTVTFAPNNPQQGKNTIVGSVILSDYDTGESLAVLEGAYLTKIRTGAISGVATKYLAQQNAKTLCVIGTGEQAEGLVEAVLAVRNITHIQLFNRTYDKAVIFANKLAAQYDITVEVFEDVEDGMHNAEVIVTATNATSPVFQNALTDGVHINAVGSFKPDMQELPSVALQQADKVVVESSDTALEETGDLINPIEEGVFKASDLYGELGNIVAGRLEGRLKDEEITVFKSVGLAIVDIVVANYFYQKLLKSDE